MQGRSRGMFGQLFGGAILFQTGFFMDHWAYIILVATGIYGVMNFLFKVAAERGLEADLLVSVTGATVASLSLATILVLPRTVQESFTVQALTYALFNGLAFGAASLCKLAALKRAPAAVVFPINRLNTVLVMIIGFVVFKDAPTPIQYGGMALALGVILVVAGEQLGGAGFSGVGISGILFSLASACLTAFSMTVGKLVAGSGADRLAYICCSYSLVFLFTLAVRRAKGTAPPFLAAVLDPRVLPLGMLIGALNYAGYFLVLRAFAHGPLSLVQAVFSTSVIIPIVLAYLVYRERLTPWRMLAIILAVTSVVLISR